MRDRNCYPWRALKTSLYKPKISSPDFLFWLKKSIFFCFIFLLLSFFLSSSKYCRYLIIFSSIFGVWGRKERRFTDLGRDLKKIMWHSFITHYRNINLQVSTFKKWLLKELIKIWKHFKTKARKYNDLKLLCISNLGCDVIWLAFFRQFVI